MSRSIFAGPQRWSVCNHLVRQCVNRDVTRACLVAVVFPIAIHAQDSKAIQEDIALGKRLAALLENRANLVTDPAIVDYVNGLGQTLAGHSDTKIPLTFTSGITQIRPMRVT
jgi:hypothetical protein